MFQTFSRDLGKMYLSTKVIIKMVNKYLPFQKKKSFFSLIWIHRVLRSSKEYFRLFNFVSWLCLLCQAQFSFTTWCSRVKLLERSRERLCGKTAILLSEELFGGAAQHPALLAPQSSAEVTFALEKSQDLWDSSMSNGFFSWRKDLSAGGG